MEIKTILKLERCSGFWTSGVDNKGAGAQHTPLPCNLFGNDGF